MYSYKLKDIQDKMDKLKEFVEEGKFDLLSDANKKKFVALACELETAVDNMIKKAQIYA